MLFYPLSQKIYLSVIISADTGVSSNRFLVFLVHLVVLVALVAPAPAACGVSVTAGTEKNQLRSERSETWNQS
jgi:hypothetical protein